MNYCRWKDCTNHARAKSPFCSGTCKKRYQRASGTNTTVEVGQEQVGHVADVPVDLCYMVEGEEVYGRPAVSYPHDTFETRPEPLDHTDIPDPCNRCIYTRHDGTRYLLDATGTAHERPKPVQVKQLTDEELQAWLKSYQGASWVNSPEHKEVPRRRAAQPTGAWA